MKTRCCCSFVPAKRLVGWEIVNDSAAVIRKKKKNSNIVLLNIHSVCFTLYWKVWNYCTSVQRIDCFLNIKTDSLLYFTCWLNCQFTARCVWRCVPGWIKFNCIQTIFSESTSATRASGQKFSCITYTAPATVPCDSVWHTAPSWGNSMTNRSRNIIIRTKSPERLF